MSEMMQLGQSLEAAFQTQSRGGDCAGLMGGRFISDCMSERIRR